MEHKKGKKFVSGKTKDGFNVIGNPRWAIFKNKSAITKHNDPGQTKQLKGKEIYATITTCKIFEFLRQAGIPVAYIKQLSSAEFVAEKTSMIGLEVIARRFADGSYLKRCPQFKIKGPELFRFRKLIFELFLKTTDGKFVAKQGNVLIEGLTPETDDPLIIDPYNEDGIWELYHPKMPKWAEDANLDKSVFASDVLPDKVTMKGVSYEGHDRVLLAIREITLKTFLLLECAWQQLGIRLGDFKLEFGVTESGELVISDVIDNDSWRIKTWNWGELSKELFRQGKDMEDVKKAYNLVAKLVEEKFTFPKQAIVIWRGSDKDKYPDDLPEIAGVEYIDIACSGHKGTIRALNKLNEVESRYPGNAVIAALVGLSNGLGPINTAHTNLPVISVSLTGKDHPEDIASSTRMPSDVPNVTMLPSKNNNFILAALNILSLTNPAAYTYRRYRIEEQDDNMLVF